MSSMSTMLRYSICSTGFKQQSIEQIGAMAKDCGLEGIEIWSGHIEHFLKRGHRIHQLKDLLLEHQFEVPVISEYTYLSGDEEDYEKELERIHQAAQWCNELGCPRIRTFLGRHSSQVALAKEWELTIQRLGEAVTLCDKYGVKLAVEIHNNTFADTASSLAAMFRDVPAAGLELIYDGFNLFVDSLAPVPVLESFFPYIHHVHFKDYLWNHRDWSLSKPVSVLQGDAGHTAILSKLLELSYEGTISFEYFGEDAISCTKQSLAEVKEFIRSGAYLRQ